MRPGSSMWFGMGSLLAGTLAAGMGFAQQQIISAQSGTVQYVEGTVYAGNQRIERKFGQFPSLQPGEELRTEDGRAEVLLTPGAFLRLAENSSVRMVSNHLTDTRLEVLNGTIMVECDELLKDNAVSLVFHGETIHLQRQGLYRLEVASSELQVYKGQALVETASGQKEVKSGKQAVLADTVAVTHFDEAAAKDDLYHWSSQRSSNLAYASVTASQSVLNSGSTWNTGGWMWSSLLDEWTFLPGAGLLYGPFGWGFWSPVYMGTYYPAYYAPTSGAGGSGFKGPARSGSGTATNPRPVRPAPGLAVAPTALRSGDRFGGVAASSSFQPGFYAGSSRSGFAGGPASGGFGSMPNAASPGLSNASSSGSSAGGGFSGGGSGGGFGGRSAAGGAPGGGGGRR